MALTAAITKLEAEAAALLANEIVNLNARVGQFIEHNSDMAIDWAAGSTPAYISEDAAGNITGLNFSRAAVANVIGSLVQFRNYLTGAAVSQGDHLGNCDILARPLG